MNAVARRARRGVAPAPGSQDSMDASVELLGDLGMALSAGLRNIGAEDRRLWINQRPQIMCSMTVLAGDPPCLSVNALFEELSRGTCSQRMLSGELYIRMAAVTGFSNIQGMDHGSRILDRKDGMFTVAVVTVSRLLSTFHKGLGMETLLVLFIHLLVARAAIDAIPGLLSTGGMGLVLDPRMTV